MLFIFTVQEKRPADVLKAFRKDLIRVTCLGHSQGVNFESLVQMHFPCIIFNFILPNVSLNNTKELAVQFQASGEMPQRRLNKVPQSDAWSITFSGCPQDVHFEHIYKTHFVVKFSVLVYQMYVLDTKKLLILYSFILGETSQDRRPWDILRTST